MSILRLQLIFTVIAALKRNIFSVLEPCKAPAKFSSQPEDLILVGFHTAGVIMSST